jgi:hypothetical protein
MKIFDTNFINDKIHEVQIDEVGRLDIISSRIYGNALYYRVIAHANSIKLPLMSRYTLRTAIECAKNEIYLKYGKMDSEKITELLEYSYDSVMDYHMIADSQNGIFTDIYYGRKLVIPNPQSAIKFMMEYK